MLSNRKLLTGGALAVLAVLFVAVVLICNALLRGARVDLTQNHLYTLSQGTRNILKSIDEPIQLHLFYSDRATQDQPQLRTYAQRVREVLEEMVARAGGEAQARCHRSAAHSRRMRTAPPPTASKGFRRAAQRRQHFSRVGRHQFHQWQGDDSVPAAGQGGVP